MTSLSFRLQSRSARMSTEAGYSVRTIADIPMAHRPTYIALEGADGTGKTTALPKIAQFLRERGKEVVEVVEPTLENRERINANKDKDAEWYCEEFGKDRRALLMDVVWPALRERKWVISDRSLYSSFAYQVGGKGLDVNVCDRICFKSVFPMGAPGQVVWFKWDGVDRSVNEDLMPPMDKWKVDAYYGRLRKADMPMYKTRWRAIPCLPSEEQLLDVSAFILGYGQGYEDEMERQWQQSIEEWR